jgi:magnesium-transporting ATPase (P-type)
MCTVLLVICILYLTEVFLTLTEVFPCFFLSCKANARLKLAKKEYGPHSSKLVVICVVLLLFVLFYVFVCKCVLYYCHRVTTQIAVNKYVYHIIYKMQY